MQFLRKYRKSFLLLILGYMTFVILFGAVNLNWRSDQPDTFQTLRKVLNRLRSGSLFFTDFLLGGNFFKNILSLIVLPFFLSEYYGLNLLNWSLPAAVKIIRFTNLFWAIGCAYLVYNLSSIIYGKETGLISLILLSLNKGFLNQSFIATEDIGSFCLMMLSLFLTKKYVDTNQKKYFILTWLSIGLCLGMKTTVGIAMVPMTIYLSRCAWSKSNLTSLFKDLLSGFLFMGLAYVITTPSVLVHYDNFLSHIFYQVKTRWGMSHKGFQKTQSTYLLHLFKLAYSGGYPLLYVYISGFVYSLVRLYRNRLKPMELEIILTLTAYYGFVGSWDNTLDHYMILMVPILSVISAPFVNDLLQRFPKRWTVLIAITFTIYGIGYTAVCMEKINQDVLTRAGNWVKSNYPKNTIIDVHGPISYSPFGVRRFRNWENIHYLRYQGGTDSKFWKAAKRRIANNIPELISLSSPHYERYFIHPNTYPEITRLLQKLILNNHENYRISKSFGREPTVDFSYMSRFKNGFFSTPLPPAFPNILLLENKLTE